ncbi:MAG: hypothetical protein IT534_00750 [Bauldia sp.]|nr:hypothetical protein [Bauldia sp.]
MRRIVAAIAFMATATSAMAALPPEYQRMEEFSAIMAAIEANGIPAAIGPINAIEYVGPDVYEIRSDRCIVRAFIVSTPAKGPPIVGPRQFTVELQPPVC